MVQLLSIFDYHVESCASEPDSIHISMATHQTSHKQCVQCSGNTKNCFNKNWQLSVCQFYSCHFGRLCIRILVQENGINKIFPQKSHFRTKIIMLGFDALPSICAVG